MPQNTLNSLRKGYDIDGLEIQQPPLILHQQNLVRSLSEKLRHYDAFKRDVREIGAHVRRNSLY